MITIRQNLRINNLILVLSFFLLVPSFAYADAGLPMILLTFPAMLIALVPVIIIEGLIYKSSLMASNKSAFYSSAVSNLVSTLIGIPLSWVMLFIIELLTTGGRAFGIENALGKVIAVTLQAAWLIPYEGDLHWMIPIASMVCLIPAFFVSVFIEYIIVKRFFKTIEKRKVKLAVWKANGVTYFLLFIFYFGSLIYRFKR